MKILRIGCVLGGFLFLVLSLSAQTFTSLFSFDCNDGCYPPAGLVQATNGDLYGTTFGGGANSGGTVYKITPSGTLTTLHSFMYGGEHGYRPQALLVQATNGKLYGTTQQGGTNGDGTVFRITPSGAFTVLHSFDGTGGSGPTAGLVQASNGDLYGTTYAGGASGNGCGGSGCGTVFKITPSGKLTRLHSFWGRDGVNPYAGLIQATDGSLYGTTSSGGAHGDGTVFKITPSGKLTTLHSFSFDCNDGCYPTAGLVQGTDGNFYGTTCGAGSGANCLGASGYGTVFKMTSSGKLTTLHSFHSYDGAYPHAGLVQATDGNFYGTTQSGGAGSGTIFKITPQGKLTTLHSFDGTDGNSPEGLVQDTNGNFYGTTSIGGSSGVGTVFKVSKGRKLNPAVQLRRSSRQVLRLRNSGYGQEWRPLRY